MVPHITFQHLRDIKPMIKIHEKASRGRPQSGWRDSYHTFTFGQFSNQTRMRLCNVPDIKTALKSEATGPAILRMQGDLT